MIAALLRMVRSRQDCFDHDRAFRRNSFAVKPDPVPPPFPPGPTIPSPLPTPNPEPVPNPPPLPGPIPIQPAWRKSDQPIQQHSNGSQSAESQRQTTMRYDVPLHLK